MSIPHCDYVEVNVNMVTIHDESQIEIDIILNFSKYTIQKAMLLHGIKLYTKSYITIHEWHLHDIFTKLMCELPSHSLVNGMRSINDMSHFVLTYDDAKPFFDLIVVEKFSDDQLIGISLASVNSESVDSVKKYHHERLTELLSDLEYEAIID